MEIINKDGNLSIVNASDNINNDCLDKNIFMQKHSSEEDYENYKSSADKSKQCGIATTGCFLASIATYAFYVPKRQNSAYENIKD